MKLNFVKKYKIKKLKKIAALLMTFLSTTINFNLITMEINTYKSNLYKFNAIAKKVEQQKNISNLLFIASKNIFDNNSILWLKKTINANNKNTYIKNINLFINLLYELNANEKSSENINAIELNSNKIKINSKNFDKTKIASTKIGKDHFKIIELLIIDEDFIATTTNYLNAFLKKINKTHKFNRYMFIKKINFIKAII